jgi:hypothetical protein
LHKNLSLNQSFIELEWNLVTMKIPTILLSIIGLAATVLAAEPTPPDKYELLTGEGLERSGFVIRHADKFFGVASLHQFDGKSPLTLVDPLKGDLVRLDKARVFKQNDVQVLPVRAPSSKLQFLSYLPHFSLRPGDEVIVLGSAGDVVAGTLTARGMRGASYQSSDGPRRLEARALKPFRMAGGSGGPIIHKRTGAVVGVVLTADDAEQARLIGFETLCFGISTSKPPAKSPASNPGVNQLISVFPGGRHVTTITFTRDGTFHGSFKADSKVTLFSGKWTLRDGNLNYEYTASSGDIPLPVGTKDHDQMIAISKDRYVIQNAQGVRETYVRTE